MMSITELCKRISLVQCNTASLFKILKSFKDIRTTDSCRRLPPINSSAITEDNLPGLQEFHLLRCPLVDLGLPKSH